jgi:hypothetical protein
VLAQALPAGGPGADGNEFLKWDYRRPHRLQNGNVELVIKLSTRTGEPFGQADWCYKLFSLKGFGDAGLASAPPPAVICGSFADGEDTLRITSGSTMLADIEAAAVVGGKRMYAQAAAMLYGDSIGEYTPPPSNSGAPDWPSYIMGSSRYLYWAQTGDTFTMRAAGPGEPLDYKVYGEDGEPFAGVYKKAAGGNSFVPEHDPELNKVRTAAVKPVYFVGTTPDGGTYAYTLNMHRARDANQSLLGGFVVFFSAMGLTLVILALVHFGRRSGRLAQKPC